MSKTIFPVAMVYRVCRICGAKDGGEILMSMKGMSEDGEAHKKFMENHNKCIDYMEKPCDKCADLMSKGFLLIECDEVKTGGDLKNPYRTGRQWVITQEYAKHLFKDPNHLAKGVAFIGMEDAENLGFNKQENQPV